MRKGMPDAAGLTPEQMDMVRAIARESVAQVASELLALRPERRALNRQTARRFP